VVPQDGQVVATGCKHASYKLRIAQFLPVVQHLHGVFASRVRLNRSGGGVIAVEQELEGDISVRQVQLKEGELSGGLFKINAKPIPTYLILLLVIQVFNVIAASVDGSAQHQWVRLLPAVVGFSLEGDLIFGRHFQPSQVDTEQGR
jgi:hypothetical protein